MIGDLCRIGAGSGTDPARHADLEVGSRLGGSSRTGEQLVLADEPTGNLDPDLSLDIMNLFRDINARGTTVVVATHDREMIRRVGRRAVTLQGGRLAETY